MTRGRPLWEGGWGWGLEATDDDQRRVQWEGEWGWGWGLEVTADDQRPVRWEGVWVGAGGDC